MQQIDPQQLFFDEHQAYHDPYYPNKPLDPYYALHYFEHSPFFDANSNNTAARRDLLDINRPEVQCRYPTDTTEYIVAESVAPHLFVVRKQQRSVAGGAGAKTTVHNYYYILGQSAPRIFQAPTLHAAITSRLRKAMHYVKQGYDTFKADLAPLPQILRQHKQEQEALQQQQLEKVAELDAEVDHVGLSDALNRGSASHTSGAEGFKAGSGAAAGAAAAAAVKPVFVPPEYTREQQERWERTDNMIMRVFSKYPQPLLPKSKAQLEAEKQMEEQRQQLLQQQQAQRMQQAAPAAATTTAPAALEGQPAAAAEVPAAAAAPAPAAEVPAAVPAEAAQRSKRRRVQPASESADVAFQSAPAAAAAAAAVAGASTGRLAKRMRASSAGPPQPPAAAAAAGPAGSDYSQGSAGGVRSHGSHGGEPSAGRATAAAAGAGLRKRAATPPLAPQQQRQQQQQQQQQSAGAYRSAAMGGVQMDQAAAAAPVVAAGAAVAAVVPSGPARSVSYGGGVSALSYGTAATAATAASTGHKMKLKVKFKKNPAPWQQGAQQQDAQQQQQQQQQHG